jgi:dTDP-glucose 4,6-dehydratase
MSIVMVTGAAGFIGREIVHQLYAAGHHIVAVDAETYAARPDLLQPYRDRMRYLWSDVRDLKHLFGAEVIFNLAAESHVDNAISDPTKFVENNVLSTASLLELIRGQRPHDRPTLIHVSTDEVYGTMPDGMTSLEIDSLDPSSPYSASKAAADMLVLAWQRTYGLKARIVRPSNCYGLWQYPEKLIPKTIRSWLMGRPMTIHGDGTQTRSWLAVEDCAKALLAVWERGEDGGIYNVPGNSEVSVRAVVERIRSLCAYHEAGVLGRKSDTPIYGCERPGGDRRYNVNGERLLSLGWQPHGKLWRDLDPIVRQELESGVHI